MTLGDRIKSLRAKCAIFKRISAESGFTLIEAMIMAGVLSVIIMTFSAYTYNRAKMTQIVNQQRTYTQIQNSILNAASQTDALSQTEEQQLSALPSNTPYVPVATATPSPTPVVVPTPATCCCLATGTFVAVGACAQVGFTPGCTSSDVQCY